MRQLSLRDILYWFLLNVPVNKRWVLLIQQSQLSNAIDFISSISVWILMSLSWSFSYNKCEIDIRDNCRLLLHKYTENWINLKFNLSLRVRISVFCVRVQFGLRVDFKKNFSWIQPGPCRSLPQMSYVKRIIKKYLNSNNKYF